MQVTIKPPTLHIVNKSFCQGKTLIQETRSNLDGEIIDQYVF